jgi:hypothetical protein
MAQISEQVHSKFKVFTGALAPDGTLGALAKEVEAWVASAKVAPRSIGVEFVEPVNCVFLSVGYRDDEPPYPIKLQSVRIGKIEDVEPASVARLEAAMAGAGASVASVICHELYVTAECELLMVFMTHQDK